MENNKSQKLDNYIIGRMCTNSGNIHIPRKNVTGWTERPCTNHFSSCTIEMKGNGYWPCANCMEWIYVLCTQFL